MRRGGRAGKPRSGPKDQTTPRMRTAHTTTHHTTACGGTTHDKARHKTAQDNRVPHDTNKKGGDNTQGRPPATEPTTQHDNTPHSKTPAQHGCEKQPRTTQTSSQQTAAPHIRTQQTARHEQQPEGGRTQPQHTAHAPHARPCTEEEKETLGAGAEAKSGRNHENAGAQNKEQPKQTERERRGGGQPQSAEAQGDEGRKQRKTRDKGAPEKNNKKGKKKGGGRRAPRPTAPRAGKHKKPETAGAREEKRKNKEKKTEARATQARRRPNKEEGQNGRRKGEAHRNAPGRPARPTRPRRAHTSTHARDPGVASSHLTGEVSASTPTSSGAPTESPVERRTVGETGRASDQVHTRQTTAAHAVQDRSPEDPPGTTPSRAPNGYDSDGASRPCLDRGQKEGQRARFSAGFHVPRAAAQ